jgi:hypothetical protein
LARVIVLDRKIKSRLIAGLSQVENVHMAGFIIKDISLKVEFILKLDIVLVVDTSFMEVVQHLRC